MKLWAMPCRATQDGRVTVESSDKTWSTGGGVANHSSFLAIRTPWTVWKGKKIWHQKMSSPGWKVSNMLLGKHEDLFAVCQEAHMVTEWALLPFFSGSSKSERATNCGGRWKLFYQLRPKVHQQTLCTDSPGNFPSLCSRKQCLRWLDYWDIKELTWVLGGT